MLDRRFGETGTPFEYLGTDVLPFSGRLGFRDRQEIDLDGAPSANCLMVVSVALVTLEDSRQL